MTPEIEAKRRDLFRAFYMGQDHQAAAHLAYVRDDGEYGYHSTRVAWRAFNAALDSVVIELPPLNNSHIGGPDSEMGPSYEQVEDQGFDYGVKACKALIEQTGLGIKVV